MIDVPIQIGEIYKQRFSRYNYPYYYLLTKITDTEVTTAVLSELSRHGMIHKTTIVHYTDFMQLIHSGEVTRIGQLSSEKLAKFLLNNSIFKIKKKESKLYYEMF